LESGVARTVAISEAESVVMDVLWRAARPLACEDVVKDLADAQEWQESTVKTLLGRLLKKGAVAAQKDGRRYLYAPLLTRELWLSFESKRFLKRMFDGRVAPLVAHFGRHDRLSKQDIAELKRLIAEMEDG
jgi:BlaI family transcriptional regulator, penicillinase repressor